MSKMLKIINFIQNPKGAFGFFILGFFALIGVFAPWIAPDYNLDIASRLQPPSWGMGGPILGCDIYGGDLLSGIIWGARTSFYVAGVTICLSLGVGTFLGFVAGYWGGLWDMILMRVVDILMAFPGILLAMAISSLLEPSLENIILAITVTGWTSSARIVRGQILSLKTKDYILAAQTLGVPWPRLFYRYFLPSLLPLLVITGTSSFGGVILTESSLSFLGLGAKSATQSVSWGGLLSQGKTVLFQAPHVSFFPGLAMSLVILSCNFLGDRLRDVYDKT